MILAGGIASGSGMAAVRAPKSRDLRPGAPPAKSGLLVAELRIVA